MCSTQPFFFIFGGHAVTNVHHWAQPQFQLKFSWNDHDTGGDPTKNNICHPSYACPCSKLIFYYVFSLFYLLFLNSYSDPLLSGHLRSE